VQVDMGEFFFKPSKLSVSAGKIQITAPNTGKVVHELVLLKTNQSPANLQRESNGGVNEDAYQSPGEIPDVNAGSTKSVTIELKPGKYAMVCNVPGHYAAGMYGEVVVQ